MGSPVRVRKMNVFLGHVFLDSYLEICVYSLRKYRK